MRINPILFGLESGRGGQVRRPNRVKSPMTGNQECFFCRIETKNSEKMSRKSMPFVINVIGFSRHDMLDIEGMQNIGMQGVQESLGRIKVFSSRKISVASLN